MRYALAIIPLAMLVSHFAINVSVGETHPVWWPLHVCNVSEYLCLAYAIKPSKPLGNIVFGVVLIAGVLALLFPGWAYCAPLTWSNVCGFGEHSLIVAFVVSLLRGRDIRPRLHDVWQPIVAFIAYAALIYPLNYRFGTNFAFLREPSPGSPLVPVEHALGNPGYIFPFIAVIAAIIVALFAWREIVERRRERTAS